MTYDVPSICPVYSDLVDLLWVISHVLDMPQDMATAVLADEVSEVSSQAHISDGGLVIAPFLDWKALEENEALAIEDLSLD